MSKKITKEKDYLVAEDIKKGEKYFFVDTYFQYIDIPLPIIKKETIYRIVGIDFSTKNIGDNYEVQRHMAYSTEEKAKGKALSELLEYKTFLNNEIDSVINKLTK